ncbi:uncharacterized protein F4822DRAFT_432276 [Hypoxylon trugodes]|uniref:uncharacterized protein n=1 Tax=Hypoxylon trugodes TaxID=326681 RepID=UPI00219EE440|nr:uncharacterized protein F4822DRAFT_432276 [Hypoxylon trugodes]KAI1385425.1 hypothetical protein F4822DRAFT_432276 [Hypoxylon trugodes]
MHVPNTFKIIALLAPVFFQSTSGWSFTLYNDTGCGNSTAPNTNGDTVQRTGDVDCDSVPNAEQQKSILGNIANGTECRISFYPREGCGDKVAFGLTQYTTSCLSIDDFTTPLAYFKATDCA